jgi:hypothetical protein
MNQIPRCRFIWSLLMFSLAAAMLADPVPPDIQKWQVITLDVATIERNANASTPFVLDLGAAQLKVVLLPAPVWPKEGLIVTEVEKDGSLKESVVTGNITYAGNVVDEDPKTNEVRFTIADGAIDGYVWSSAGYWFIAPLSRFDPKAQAGQHLIYGAHDVDAVHAIDEAIDEVCCYEVPPSPPKLPLNIILVADKEYVSASTTPFVTRQATLINNVNGIYHHQIGRSFIFVRSYCDPQNVFLKSINVHDLKQDLIGYIHHFAAMVPNPPPGMHDVDILGARIAHLTTGKDVTGNAGSATTGTGEIAGRFSVCEQRRSDYANKLLASHELGHNFNAPDEAADCVCVNNDCGDTIMTGVWDGHIIPWFSDGLHGPAHNARKKIRDFMDAHGF